MKFNRRFTSTRLRNAVLIGTGFFLISTVTFILMIDGTGQALLVGQVILFAILAFATLRQPYLGIVVTAASLPVVDILPPVPYATSAISLLGGVTLVGYLLQPASKLEKTHLQHNGLIWGLLFIAWMAISNPSAAFLPAPDGRNWFFTFLQLLILAWLAAWTLNTFEKQRVLMWVFSLVTVFSSFYAIQQGHIGETVRESVRSEGLAGGANSAARYFIVAFVLMNCLRNSSKSRLLRLVLFIGMAIVLFGAIYTVSRTGLLLLVAMLGMLFFQRMDRRYQIQTFFLFLVVLTLTWFFADSVLSIFRSILPAIRQGTDTIGLRYGLWQAGWRMWLDKPIHGVGIGQYSEQLVYYGSDLLPANRLYLRAHNMYIQILAETGIIGFILFLAIFIVSIRSLLLTMRSNDASRVSPTGTWFIVLALMLLGGITKHDHYDKLIWTIVGISSSPIWLNKDLGEHAQN